MSKFLDRINEYIKPSTPEDKAAAAKQHRKDEIEKRCCSWRQRSSETSNCKEN